MLVGNLEDQQERMFKLVGRREHMCRNGDVGIWWWPVCWYEESSVDKEVSVTLEKYAFCAMLELILHFLEYEYPL
jgi:hypothetical protein